MFSLCRTPLAASTVECSLSCHLLSPSESVLVTAGADVLRVFRLRPHEGINEGTEPGKQMEMPTRERNWKHSVLAADYSDGFPPKMRLECALSWRLHGTVQSMHKVSVGSRVEAKAPCTNFLPLSPS